MTTEQKGMLPAVVAAKALAVMHGHTQVGMALRHNETGDTYSVTLHFNGAVTVQKPGALMGELYENRANFAAMYGLQLPPTH